MGRKGKTERKKAQETRKRQRCRRTQEKEKRKKEKTKQRGQRYVKNKSLRLRKIRDIVNSRIFLNLKLLFFTYLCPLCFVFSFFLFSFSCVLLHLCLFRVSCAFFLSVFPFLPM